MYLSHYGLNEKPFVPSPDPRYLWFGDRQLGLYASLEASILQGGNTVVLTGDVGTGKTTFIKSLAAGLRQKTVFAQISDPALNELDFYNLVAHGFGIERAFNSKDAFTGFLRAVVRESAKMRKQVVVAVDESQRIDFGLLKKIWFLSRMEPDLAISVTWIFVGQGEFLDHFKGDGVDLLIENNVYQFHMHPLDNRETGDYIRFRMKRAGSKQAVFGDDAIELIYSHTNGHPRLINSICDLALLHGYADNRHKINSKTIDVCAGKVCLSHEHIEEHIEKKPRKKVDLKATAWLYASLLCLTITGVLTYRLLEPQSRIQQVRPKSISIQNMLPLNDVQTSLSNATLKSLRSSNLFQSDPQQGIPPGGMNWEAQDYDHVLSEKAYKESDAVSDGAAQDGASDDASGKIKTSARERVAPQPEPGAQAEDKPPTKAQGNGRGEEPDPTDIIEWLLKK